MVLHHRVPCVLFCSENLICNKYKIPPGLKIEAISPNQPGHILPFRKVSLLSWWLSSLLFLLWLSTVALSMRNLAWEPRVGVRQGSVVFGHNLDKTTDLWWLYPCLWVVSLFRLQNICWAQVLTRLCVLGAKEEWVHITDESYLCFCAIQQVLVGYPF